MEGLLAAIAFVVLFVAFVILPSRLLKRGEAEHE